jgi:hypothetical protein
MEGDEVELGRRHLGLRQQGLYRLRGPFGDAHVQPGERRGVAARQAVAQRGPLLVAVRPGEKGEQLRVGGPPQPDQCGVHAVE